MKRVAPTLLLLLFSCGASDDFTSLVNPFSLALDGSNPTVGQTLTCSASPQRKEIVDAAEHPTYTFQWWISNDGTTNFEEISGESAATLKVTKTFAHKFILCGSSSTAPTGENSSAESGVIQIEDTPPVGKDVEFYGSNTSSFTVYFALSAGVEDADGDAVTSIEIQNLQGGTLADWTCEDGFCTTKFSPSQTLTEGMTIFEFKAANVYGSMQEWSKAVFRSATGQ